MTPLGGAKNDFALIKMSISRSSNNLNECFSKVRNLLDECFVCLVKFNLIKICQMFVFSKFMSQF